MTAQLLRRFLMILFAVTFAPMGIKAETIEAHSSNSSTIAELTNQWMDASEKIKKSIQSFSESQQHCLMHIHEKYKSKVHLILLDAEKNAQAFNDFVATDKPVMTKEEALLMQGHIIKKLAEANIALQEAQDFFRIIAELETLQQKMFALKESMPQEKVSQELEEALEHEEEQPSNPLAEAEELILGMGPFAKILLLDTEKDPEILNALLEKINATTSSKLPREEILKARTQALVELQKREISREKIAEIIAQNHKKMIEKIAEKVAPVVEILNHNPELEADYFTTFATNLSEKMDTPISSAHMISVRKQILDQLTVCDITVEELQSAAKEITLIAQKESDAAWYKKAKHLGAAITASTLFGISDLFIQLQKSIPQAIGSTWNWIMGTVGFYPKHEGTSKKSQWTWSKEGMTARAFQAAALIPTGYLFKERIMPQYEGLMTALNEIDGLMTTIEDLKKKYRVVRELLTATPYVLPLITRQQRETPTQAFQEIMRSSKKGLAAELFCSKAIPLAAYIAWNHKTLNSFYNIIHADQKHNVWSNTAFAFAPILQTAISDEIEKALSKRTPKTGVFWRTFLNNSWGSRLVQIAYGSALRAFLYQQYAPANAANPVEFGDWKKSEDWKKTFYNGTWKDNFSLKSFEDIKKLESPLKTKFLKDKAQRGLDILFKGLRVDRGQTVRKENITLKKVEGSVVSYKTVDEKALVSKIRPLKTPAGPTIKYIEGHVPHLGETGIGTAEFQAITGQEILVPQEKHTRRHKETKRDGFTHERIDDFEAGTCSESTTEKQTDGSFTKTTLIKNPYQTSDARYWLPGADRKTESVSAPSPLRTVDTVKTETNTYSGYKKQPGVKTAKSKMDAVKPFFMRSFAQLLAEDVTVAATTSAFYASNNHIARVGRACGRSILRRLVALKMIKKSDIQDVQETAATIQKATQMGASVLIGVQGVMKNPLTMVNNPQALQTVLAKLMDSPEKMAGNSKTAQLMVHKFFANKMFEHIFKALIASQAQKTLVKDPISKWKYVNYDMSESYSKKQAGLAMAAWAALWITATTLLTEPPKTDLTPQDKPDDFEDSFKTSKESLEEAAQGAEDVAVA